MYDQTLGSVKLAKNDVANSSKWKTLKTRDLEYMQVDSKNPGQFNEGTRGLEIVEKSEYLRRLFCSSGLILELFTELNSDRNGQGYGIWAKEAGRDILVVSKYF